MRQHSLLWLILMALALLFSPLLVSQERFQSCFDEEMMSALRWYGKSEALIVATNGERLYSSIMGDTGVDGLLRSHFAKPTPENLDVAPGVKMPDKLAGAFKGLLGYWSNMMLNIHLLCYRLAHTWTWLLYVLPFTLAIIFDGIMIRKAKIASFRYTSPTVYNLSWHAIIGIIAFSLVYFTMTFPISVFYYPIALAVIGVLMRMVIGNIQHSA